MADRTSLRLCLLLAGYKLDHLLQGPVGLLIPYESIQDVLVSKPPPQLVADDFLAVVCSSIAGPA